MASVLGVHAYHSYSYYECWHDSQPVSVCPKFLANLIPSIQVIPEQHTAYHTLTIFHTGDKLKFGRQIAWKCVALWKHSSSLVAFTVKFWWHCTVKFWWHLRKFWWLSSDKFGGHSVCVWWWYQSNYRHKNHPKKYQWWSCHASLVVIWLEKWVSRMVGFETEAKVCKSSVVFRLQQEAGLQAVVAGLVTVCWSQVVSRH